MAAAAVLLAGGMTVQEAPLVHPLEVRLGQSGFAGVTGTIYEVEPDGAWSMASFVNETRRPPESTGTLDAEQLAALAELLHGDIASDISAAPPVNPTLIEIRYGSETWTVAMPPGTEFSGCDDAADTGCQVRRVAEWLMTEIGVPR